MLSVTNWQDRIHIGIPCHVPWWHGIVKLIENYFFQKIWIRNYLHSFINVLINSPKLSSHFWERLISMYEGLSWNYVYYNIVVRNGFLDRILFNPILSRTLLRVWIYIGEIHWFPQLSWIFGLIIFYIKYQIT